MALGNQETILIRIYYRGQDITKRSVKLLTQGEDNSVLGQIYPAFKILPVLVATMLSLANI